MSLTREELIENHQAEMRIKNAENEIKYKISSYKLDLTPINGECKELINEPIDDINKNKKNINVKENLTEILPKRELSFLLDMDYNTFKIYGKTDYENENERLKHFNMLKSFCKKSLKNNGVSKHEYHYSSDTPDEQGGRLYSGNGVQGLPKKIRGLLMKHTTDIDMKNAHPVILSYIGKLFDVKTPSLEYYINHREEIIGNGSNREELKCNFLKTINAKTINYKINDPFFRKFDVEMKFLQKTICNLPEFKSILKSVPEDKQNNIFGSCLNRILCKYENQILTSCKKYLINKNIEIAVNMFDGCMLYGDFYNNTDLLIEVENAVEFDFPNLNMKWDYKTHDNSIKIPEDFDETTVVNKLDTFEELCNEFEKTHAKILNLVLYVKETDDDVILFTPTKIIDAYTHISYIKIISDKSRKVPFIKDWMMINDNIRIFDNIGIYPNKLLCPSNIFNMWRPFAMELKTGNYNPNVDGMNKLLHHIKILCNHDVVVYNYFISWISQMIQYPEIKTVIITLISKEGAGKGTLIKLLTLLLGSKKVLETTKPSRDVWGDFNGMMGSSFLVNLNELSKKDTTDNIEQIKGLITDSSLTINNKGLNQIKINSYHRFIITTNNENPIDTKADDRRNVIIRSSDEMIGNKVYFNEINALMDDENVLRTIYDYFKSVPKMNEFGNIPLPKTEHQETLKYSNRTKPDLWLESFTNDNLDKTEVKLKPVEVLELFNKWCIAEGIDFNIDSLKLGVQLTQLKIPDKGISSDAQYRFKIFNIKSLKKHYNLGCLIDI